MKKIITVLSLVLAMICILSSCSADWLLAQAETTDATETTRAEGERYTEAVDGLEDFDESDNFNTASSDNRYVYKDIFGDYRVYKFGTDGLVNEIEEVVFYENADAALKAYQDNADSWATDETLLSAQLHNSCIVFVVNPILNETYKDRFNISKGELEASETANEKQ